jgi:N-succinyldiaminopimelate aminotransferase
MQALLDPGDEVVMFEPFYDSYRASVAMAGGVSRVVTLRAPDFGFDPAELRDAVGERTRLLLLNTPHNPTGRVFSRDELELIAALCRERDLLLLSDEVYEHIVQEGHHLSPATLEGMRERSVVISSAGKTFSLTGWKVGWTCAPAELTRALRTSHQFVTFCTATPLQHAVATALGAGPEYYAELSASYRSKRDRLCDGLAEIGFEVLRPQGTYFVLADIRPLGFDDDVAFCLALPERAGVVAVPPTAFYVNREEGRHLARFAFCKRDATLDEALRRLRSLRS